MNALVPDGAAPPVLPPVSVRHLVHETCQTAYRELHALLDGLTEKPDLLDRKKLMLDYVQRTRHRLARLLVAARWAGEFGRYTDASSEALVLARTRGGAFEAAAEALWKVQMGLLNAPAAKYAVGPAVDVLTTGFFPRMPKIIAGSVGIIVSPEESTHYEGQSADPSATSASDRLGPLSEDYVAQRLGAATRGTVRACLPIYGGLRVMAWRTPRKGSPAVLSEGSDASAGENSVCVVVGLRNAWRVELSLDRLDLATAIFRVHRVYIDVAPDLGAAVATGFASSSVTGCSQPPLLSVAQAAILRRMADDRMRVASERHSRTTGVTPKSDENDINDPEGRRIEDGLPVYDVPDISRSKAMLVSLRDMMSGEFCIPLAMEQLKLQAAFLSSPSSPWHSFIQHTVNSDGSLKISYWKGDKYAASFTISRGRTDYPVEEDINDGEGLLEVTHQTPLPGETPAIVESLQLDKLNLEKLLLACVKVRAAARLSSVTETLSSREKLHLDPIHLRYAGSTAMLVVTIKKPGSGIAFHISLQSGGLRCRPFGSILASLPEPSWSSVGIWHGEKFFTTSIAEETLASSIVRNLHHRIELDSAARAMSALDVSVTRVLPPGKAFVAGSAAAEKTASQLVPPFAQIERRAPRRFLTLSPPPPKAEGPPISNPGTSIERISKRPKLTYATTNDALVFIQENIVLEGRARLDRYSGTAMAAASWAIAREAVERRLRRDSLIRAFSAANVASAAAPPHGAPEEAELDVDTASRTPLKLKCEPLAVLQGELLLRSNDSWQVRLKLVPPIFDRTNSTNAKGPQDGVWSIGVACTGCTLTFTYPSANAASVRGFFRDLTRARTAAALARNVPPAEWYVVQHRTPIRLVVKTRPGRSHGNAPSGQAYYVSVEYVYSKGNVGGFSVTFTPPKPTMDQLAPYIEEALDASGGSIGTILAGLLERACPIAAAVEEAIQDTAGAKIKFVTALRMRVFFTGMVQAQAAGQSANGQTQIAHAFDVDARNGGGFVDVIDFGRATAGMIAQGFAHRGGASEGNRSRDFMPLPDWDFLVSIFIKSKTAKPQMSGSTVTLQMHVLERFLTHLVGRAQGRTPPSYS